MSAEPVPVALLRSKRVASSVARSDLQRDGDGPDSSSRTRRIDFRPLLLRAPEAASLCSTSVRTWRTWGTIGKIPRPIHIGRIPFWRYDELKAWVTAGCPDRATWDAIRE